MADYRCPSCGRQTYLKKYKTCSAADCKLNPRSASADSVETGSPEDKALNHYPFVPPEFDRPGCPDCAMKDEELARLKRELAEAHRKLGPRIQEYPSVTPVTGDTPKRNANAERQRRYRERKKAEAAP